MFDLNTPVEKLYLVGPSRAKLLKKLEIETLKDLLFYFPRAHQDLSQITSIGQVKPGEFVTVKAKVLQVKSFRTKIRRLSLTQALIEDDTASLVCIWFNQPYLGKILKPHEVFLFSGKAVLEKGKLQLQNPIYEQEKPEQIHTARLVPIYPLTAQLTQKMLRMIIKTYLDKIPLPEYLPKKILNKEKLLGEDNAVKNFHFPKNYSDLAKAQNRLAFDEIFQTQIQVQKIKKQRQTEPAIKLASPANLPQKIAGLPFELTDSQTQALNEILNDFTKAYPANRILEGDVGSGKTIIAALALWVAAKNGQQAVLMAPTEVLAKQHYNSLVELFTADQIDTALLTSSSQKINGSEVLKSNLSLEISSGKVKVIFGTHALLEKTVSFKNLSLVVIDEQHRFGVSQRAQLKLFHNAHLLTMSATPIPRTLTLTLYGDLEISRLNQLPAGRIAIKTELVEPGLRPDKYQFIENQILTGRQGFVICPLIDPSDKLGVKSATEEYRKLKEEIFPQLQIGLLHGKMKPSEKEEVMEKFKDNEINLLVSTSVVEVGVDVPNATVMIIEGAERFGLAQLHQFRGRVGRSTHQSYCFLFSEDLNAGQNPRLTAFLKTRSGFELAEEDLKIRGAGELYGTAQSGYSFRIATLTNLDMVIKSRAYAEEILNEDLSLDSYPLLKKTVEQQPAVHLE
jgi:ATP-dependent DNA helicase RecG